MKIKCSQYPSLMVAGYGVQFVDGEAEVNSTVAKKLVEGSPWITTDEPFRKRKNNEDSAE